MLENKFILSVELMNQSEEVNRMRKESKLHAFLKRLVKKNSNAK